jgi:hypothetical protein
MKSGGVFFIPIPSLKTVACCLCGTNFFSFSLSMDLRFFFSTEGVTFLAAAL